MGRGTEFFDFINQEYISKEVRESYTHIDASNRPGQLGLFDVPPIEVPEIAAL